MTEFLRRLIKRTNGAPGAAPARTLATELRVQPGPPVPTKDLPRCSIVILNLNGRHHLRGCFESLRALDYPHERYEVILIDNASTDGSVEEVRTEFPWVRLQVNARNVGFSAGCNQGAAAANRPDVLVFLNNDIRVEPEWLRELVAPLVRRECDATTARMYSWDGKLMNSAGGGMNFHGIGIQRGYLEEPGPQFDEPRKTLFACGGAMAITASVFADVGGFDEEFFAYYEDVDLGWRMWVQGHSVQYAPRSICYHHHSSTSRRLPPEMIRVLQVRNPLLACFKNYDDENLRKILPALLGLAIRRTYLAAGLEDLSAFRIEHATPAAMGGVRRLFERARANLHDTAPVRRIAVADLIAINDLLGSIDHWFERRARVQARRRRSDQEIFALFLKPLWCIEGEQGYAKLHEGFARYLGIDELFAGLSVPGGDPRG